MQIIVAYLVALAFRLPALLLWGLALFLALDRWEKHPKVSQLTAIASGIMIVLSVVTSGFSVLPILLIEQGWTSEDIGILIGLLNVLQSILGAIAIGMLVKAIFGWRKTPESTIPSSFY